MVGYGLDAGNKHITTYFRKSFALTEVAHFHSLSISLLVDDGAVAYLNGQEIARVNMPSGHIGYRTLALQAIANEDGFAEFQVSPAHLRAGVNTLAVEIHQAGNRSSDISFDCSLSGEISAVVQTDRVDAPQIEITLSGDIQLTAFFDADTATVADPVVITEINFNSAPDADSDDWIELYNRSGAAIDLTGWTFSDGAGQAYAFPPDTVLWPESYLVLCRDRIKFKAVHPHVKNLLGNFPFGLSSEGESVRVLDAENRVVDRVDYASIAPWPATARGTGYTIELIDVSSDNNLGENWLAVSLFGTPGTGI